MTPDIRDRLTRVEVTLEHVREDLEQHRSDSEKRTDELKELIEKLGGKIDDSRFRWSKLATPENVKMVLYAVAVLAGGGGVAALAKAVMPDGP